ncbi:MAG: ABC transporter permease [Acetobacteraceae bacterium]
MNLAFRLARRELRGGVRGLWIVLFCLALGVAVIAAVGTMRAAVEAGLAQDARRILGGDLEVQASAPLSDDLRNWLRARGARTSDITQMRSMLVAPSGERTLVEVKAVDPAWPLVGAPQLDPPAPLATALARQDGQYGLLADPVVLDRLGVKPGDSVRLGVARFRVMGALTFEPDRVATPSIFGPRVLIAAAALPETGLVVPGSIIRYALRLTLPAPGLAPMGAEELRQAFADRGWRIRDPQEAVPTVRRFLDRTSLFLTLVGLTSLLVGGIGVANGVRAWLDARARSIATLRCLGASSGLVFGVCLIQVMTLAMAGIIIGLVAGAALPMLASGLLSDVLPVPPVPGLYPAPLALAAIYGLLIALCFSIWPLGRAARIPGAALFRDALIPERTVPTLPLILANAALALMLVALTVATAAERGFALWFCLAAGVTLLLFRLGATGLMRLTRALPRSRVSWLHLGVTNLHRPGAPTPMLLLSVGLGLSTLAAVALIQGNIRREILDQMPANAPSFFFVDIQNDQMARFEALVRAQPGPSEIRHVPSLRARIVAVNGVPVEQVHTTPETAWALRGDRGLTYAATPPEGTRLVAGTWWPADYDGPPLVSFDAGLAKGWGVGLGDTIRVNVLGRDIDLKVANLRDIAWQSLSLNFALVATPGLLSKAPHTNIATVRIDQAYQGALLRTVTDALPNVTGVRVQDVLSAVATLLDQVAVALTATGSLTLISGGMVLVGAIAANQRRRMREAVILRTLGATRQQIRAAWLVEFGLLGLAAGVVAGAVGSAASFGIAHYILHTEWAFLPGTLILTLAGSLVLMLVFGFAGTAAALRAKPGRLLRNE